MVVDLDNYDLEGKREALYQAIVSVGGDAYVTRKQVRKLIILFQEGLEDKSRENRIAVAAYLFGDAILDKLGIPFESFKNMNSPIASVLIDELTKGRETLCEDGQRTIAAAEKAIKASVVS